MGKITFRNAAHRDFYMRMLHAAKRDDTYHRAFFYTMGILPETRNNIQSVFDFKEGGINPDGLNAGWQTGGTRRVTRLAFNLWNGWTEDGMERLSSPYEIFDCEATPYLLEAIKLKYPEYCREFVRDADMEMER